MVQTSASFRRGEQDIDGSISLAEIISALSYALDLTEGAVHGHALRTCLLGMRIAKELKLPSDQTNGLYFALLMKDIGCSSNASRLCQIVGGDDRAVKAGVKFEDWQQFFRAEFFHVEIALEECVARLWRGSKDRQDSPYRSHAAAKQP